MNRLIPFVFVIILNCSCDKDYHRSAEMKNELGYYQSALEDLEKCFEDNPYDRKALLLRGRVYQNLEMPDYALADFNVILSDTLPDLTEYQDDEEEDEPSPVSLRSSANFHIGTIYYDKGLPDTARAFFDEAVYYDSTWSYYYVWRGLTFIKTAALQGPDHYQLAKNDFEKAVNINKYAVWGHYGKGVADYYMADYKSAIKNLDLAIYLDNRFGDAWFYRGLSKFKSGNKNVCEDLAKAVKYGLSSHTSKSHTSSVMDSLMRAAGCR